MSEEPDWDDAVVQDQWCGEVRGHVETYLRDEQVPHGRIAAEPTWFVAPYVALWAVESAGRPGAVGAWVISGDVPMDLASADEHEHPRDAMHAIADRWLAYADDARAGRPVEAFEGLGQELDVDFVKMLVSRAETLHEWAADDELWREEGGA